MAGKSAHGRNGKFPYYEHSWAIKNQASLSKRLLKCEPQRVPAGIFEKAVWEEVRSFLLSEDVAQGLLDAAKRLIPENKVDAEITRLKRKSQALALQSETLTERISRLPKGMNEKPFFDQMMKLQETQKLIEFQMIELKSQLQADDIIDLENLIKFTAALKALIKRQIINLRFRKRFFANLSTGSKSEKTAAKFICMLEKAITGESSKIKNSAPAKGLA